MNNPDKLAKQKASLDKLRSKIDIQLNDPARNELVVLGKELIVQLQKLSFAIENLHNENDEAKNEQMVHQGK